MKKFISSMLSLAFLSGLFVNSSFAAGIQPSEVAQEKAPNTQLNQSELTAQEKTAEKLKSDLKKYNEKQQKLIQKYENMPDQKFRWDKIKKAFVKILKVLVGCGIVGIFGGVYYYVADKYLKKGCEAALNAMQEGFQETLSLGALALIFDLFS